MMKWAQITVETSEEASAAIENYLFDQKANGVEIPISKDNMKMNTAELYKYANPSTVYLECWGKN